MLTQLSGAVTIWEYALRLFVLRILHSFTDWLTTNYLVWGELKRGVTKPEKAKQGHIWNLHPGPDNQLIFLNYFASLQGQIKPPHSLILKISDNFWPEKVVVICYIHTLAIPSNNQVKLPGFSILPDAHNGLLAQINRLSQGTENRKFQRAPVSKSFWRCSCSSANVVLKIKVDEDLRDLQELLGGMQPTILKLEVGRR